MSKRNAYLCSASGLNTFDRVELLHVWALCDVFFTCTRRITLSRDTIHGTTFSSDEIETSLSGVSAGCRLFGCPRFRRSWRRLLANKPRELYVDSVYQIPPQATFVQHVSPLEIVAAHIRLFETAQTFYSVNIPPDVSLFLCTLG